jgi:glycosyltransferase involved in cell wall biosynthesis
MLSPVALQAWGLRSRFYARINMTTPATLRVFYPTRFHIFDQLCTPTFENTNRQIEIYSVYPPRYFQSSRYASLGAKNKTLWLGLTLRVLMRIAGRLGVRGPLARGFRSLYITGCATEFRLRTRNLRPGVVLASAGYLGNNITALQRAGHRVIVNHGSLYEPSVRHRMQSLSGSAEDTNANWSHPSLTQKMDVEFAAADAVIVCSPTACASFPKTLSPKIYVVPLGAPKPPLPAARHEGASGITFLHISNLSFGKNVTRVLDAFAQVCETGDELIIGGPAPRNSALRHRLTSPEPGVRWLGKLDRTGVIKAMEQADVFVHPSYADGWGMVVTEALTAGLPVIASPFTGAASYYADISKEGSDSVLLAEPSDTEAIAEAMIQMRQKLRFDPAFTPVTPMSWSQSAELLSAALDRLP